MGRAIAFEGKPFTGNYSRRKTDGQKVAPNQLRVEALAYLLEPYKELHRLRNAANPTQNGSVAENGSAKYKGPLSDITSYVEKAAILERLSLNSWNISATAESLGITRRILGEKIGKYNLPKILSIKDGHSG